MKYKKGQVVDFNGKKWNVTHSNKHGITGPEYDLEAVLPDRSGHYETAEMVPEGFINIAKNAL